tara:strand:- start:824 stop:1330 length:507 start_codon:yes stop_codon:yes gene_type:complete
MQIKAKITYDARKLAQDMPKLINKIMVDLATDIAKESKLNIKKGLSPALTETTKTIRKKRGQKLNPPLFASGKLHNSIKLKTTKNTAKISMFLYGVLHHKGFTTASNSMIPGVKVPKRPFILASKRTFNRIVSQFSRGVSASFAKEGKGALGSPVTRGKSNKIIGIEY